MKKVLSLIMSITILLSTVLTTMIVSANISDYCNTYDVYTTKINSNYLGASTGDNFVGTSMTVNDWSYGLSAMGWGGTWRQTLLLYDKSNSKELKTKANAKYIVNMNYSIESSNNSWGVQVGLFGGIGANGVTNKNTSVRLDDYFVHKSNDVGKTFTYSVAFTAADVYNVGFQFAGSGTIKFNSITLLELPAQNAGNVASVIYNNEGNKTGEFVIKNTACKTPTKEGADFKGWYKNADFTGEAVTAITEDVVLYAKWPMDTNYEIVRTESASPDNLIGASSGVSISMSGNKITTASYNGYKLNANGWKMWRPAFLFLTESGGVKSTFMTKKDARYIVEMEYVVESNRSDGHCLQVGLFGNIGTNGQTENATWLDTDKEGNKLYNTHPAADSGKTIHYTVAFTAQSAHNVGLIFYGQGAVTLNSIKISELPVAEVNNYAVVKYVDGDDVTFEFVAKNGTLKKPEKEYYVFDGWYDNKDYSGNKITTVNADTTLYAKWIIDPSIAVINLHDGNTTVTKKYNVGDKIDAAASKEGYNFLGWYKYSNFVGRPITAAVEGLTDLYAKWEEKNPDVITNVDITKNVTMVTTAKTADSKVELKDGKLIFDIYNYERQLNSTDTSNSDSWFPAYYLKDSNGNNVALEIGSTYELEVTYKIVDVKAGDNIGLQIGFGADGQVGSRTRIKGYAVHKAEDEGKEFTYSTSYTAQKFNFGQEHLSKLLFSGQGELEVSSVKIKKILPIIKDTVIGVQDYEDYNVGTNVGVLGNKKGTEVTDTVNHTIGNKSKKALILNLNTNMLRLSGNTIISLEQEGQLKPFTAVTGSAYRVTFYMYAKENLNHLTWSVNSVDDTLKNDYLSYFRMETKGDVSLKKGEWQKITAYIPVLKGCESSRNLLAIAVCSDGYDGKAVYIDDVKIEQLVDSEVLLYDTNGGEELLPQRAFKGQSYLSFKEPSRKGYLFDGWYYDAECKLEAKPIDKFPEDKTEITLYAKWITEPTKGYAFTAGSFDAEIYDEGINPYENTVADMDSPIEFENNKGMTQNTAWVKDSGIYGNGTADTDGALTFSNELYSSYTDSKGYNVIRLVNEDGTPFTVLKGERYTIDFDYIFASHKGLSYIIPIISEHSAYADIGHNSFQTLDRVSVMETDTDYLNYKQSFVAERTGYVYIAVTGRDDNANVDTHCYERVYVDNLKINLNPNVTKLVIKQGSSVWYTKYGVAGEKLILPNAVKTGTDTFDGFYLDAEFKTRFDGFYPEKDTTIYVKLKKDSYNTPSDFSKPIVIDFEETELLEDFYRQQKYMTSWSRETANEWILVTNDKENALSGKNYIKLNGYSHYWNQAKFALYDPGHPENVMLLDKGGKYRIKVMVRCEDIYEFPVNMTVCLEKPSQQHLLAENGNVKLEYDPTGDKNGYFMFVGDIEVKSDMEYYPSLAIRRNANDLQTILIDTVSVEKLRDCTVKFEENGGTVIEDAVIQIHDLLFDPGVPYKDGFVFDGWYTDEKFSKKWDFDNYTVEDDMTLYAKWSVEVIVDDGPKEEAPPVAEDVITEEITEETVDNGKAPNLIEADKVVIEKEDTVTLSENGGLSVMLIVLICIGSAVLLAAAAFVAIILIRKNKKKAKGI